MSVLPDRRHAQKANIVDPTSESSHYFEHELAFFPVLFPGTIKHLNSSIPVQT